MSAFADGVVVGRIEVRGACIQPGVRLISMIETPRRGVSPGSKPEAGTDARAGDW